MFDNFNVNLRKNEGFPTCIPCILSIERTLILTHFTLTCSVYEILKVISKWVDFKAISQDRLKVGRDYIWNIKGKESK